MKQAGPIVTKVVLEAAERGGYQRGRAEQATFTNPLETKKGNPLKTQPANRDIPALPATRSSTALELPDNLDIEAWLEVGQTLGHAERSLMWWIGDWWAYGEQRDYGKRKAVVESEDWTGPNFQVCANAGWVCRRSAHVISASSSRRLSLPSWMLATTHRPFSAEVLRSS
jgi:hypothetical protein